MRRRIGSPATYFGFPILKESIVQFSVGRKQSSNVSLHPWPIETSLLRCQSRRRICKYTLEMAARDVEVGEFPWR